MKYSFLLFDLDNTLLDFTKSEEQAIEKTLISFDIEPTLENISLYSTTNGQMWKMLERGEITRERLRYDRFALFLETLGFKRDVIKMSTAYEENLSQGYFILGNAKAVLDVLYKKIPMYALTNGISTIQHRRIEGSGIKKYFEEVFISEEIGFNKPDSRYFEKCFSLIKGFNKSKALMIGDTLSSDIAGGINVNVPTVWFNPLGLQNNTSFKPTYEINNLEELLSILN
ncbi:MAG: YjjG family noncanonical pyrimidine nucleotidase [Sphaerochaetaceae bacterium]|nr:YjjG family noncanonical pyrimidine nucleotidase [Sphaerochaetaceae bacterium]